MFPGMTRAELKDEIRSLPVGGRLELLEELWRETVPESPGLLDWQKEILDRRLEDSEANPEDWVPSEEAKERLERLVRGEG